ncbi:hypothetical protein OV079_40045 [Nannocystis pusilla]|uniref:Uncharacterized protein n=1 Tax=Nannocystis pusilla TaxID=889268 RepID=A0A9X3J0G4_9BACT|nr:hypothetical protein [Nannocystis pusilla]MCY1011652.1 hypothetical protein [Nannocystis pusilla]
MTASASTFPPLLVTPPAGGFDRAAARDLVKESGLAAALHKLVRAPFGHTVLSLRALDAAIEAADLALQAGEALHAALLEDIARAGSLALPEPTRDQRMFVGAFTLTVLGDAAAPRLALVAPTPEVHGELESDGLEDLLVRPARRRSRARWRWPASTSSSRPSGSRGPARRGSTSARCGR